MSVYFLSDLHLGAPYFPDSKDSERRIVSFLDYIKKDAEAIYLLGDILDYWYEYRYAVPRGFVRFFGKLAELSDAGIKIVWIKGNHDIWIYDYLPTELGIEVVDGAVSVEGRGNNHVHSGSSDGFSETGCASVRSVPSIPGGRSRLPTIGVATVAWREKREVCPIMFF